MGSRYDCVYSDSFLLGLVDAVILNERKLVFRQVSLVRVVSGDRCQSWLRIM